MAVSLTNVDKNKRDGICVLTAQFSLTRVTGRRRRVNVPRFPFAGQVHFSSGVENDDFGDHQGKCKMKVLFWSVIGIIT